MKKYFLLALFFLCSIFLVPAYAQELTTEHIEEFKSDITINQDATIDITEEIHYYFDTYKHGIYWQYPIEYNTSGFRRATSFDLNSLYYYPEDNPNAKKSVYEESISNGWIELQIGDPDRTIKGNYVYVIDYTIQDAGISYFDDHDEVYLNVIGPGWQVPILQATANITSFTQPTEKICYTGPEGSTLQNCKFEESDNGYTLKTTSVLQPYVARKGVKAKNPKTPTTIPRLSNKFFVPTLPSSIYFELLDLTVKSIFCTLFVKLNGIPLIATLSFLLNRALNNSSI